MGIKGLKLDPRTKGILMVLAILMAAFSPGIPYNFVFMILVAILATVFGRCSYGIKFLLAYIALWCSTIFLIHFETTLLINMIVASVTMFHKVFPSIMMGGFIVKTTSLSEFMCGMEAIRSPKTLTVASAVMLRYFPSIREDIHSIGDGMKMRGITPNIIGLITQPKQFCSCLYVPLIIASGKTADELSVASISRGIENPKRRGSLIEIGFHLIDAFVILVFILYFVLAFV